MTNIYNVFTDKKALEDIARNSVNCMLFSQEIDAAKRNDLLSKIVGHLGKDTVLLPPFRCDLGRSISIGDNCFINYNATILDRGKVTIENNVFIGPNLSIYTPIVVVQ